jgi:hypothetical protein
MKSSRFLHVDYFFVTQRNTSVVNGCEWSEEQISKQKVQVSWFKLNSRNICPVRHSGCCQCCRCMCGGMKTERVDPFTCLFVMCENVCEENNGLNISVLPLQGYGDVVIFYNW